MRAKIELVGNVTVILLAVVIASVYLKDRFSNQSIQPAQVTRDQVKPDQVKPGDRLASLAGWDWGTNDRTLVLVLRKGCHFCEDSVPFYQRLVAKQQQDGSKAAIVAVFPDGADAAQEVVRSEALGVRTVAGVPVEKLKVPGTPTLLLVDRKGTVLNAWIGMLSPKQELDVMRAAVY